MENRQGGNTPIKVCIVFGEQASRHIADGKVTEEVLDGFNEYEFATQELADAFMDGVEAASGFLEHFVPEESDLKRIKRKIARQSKLTKSSA